MHGYTQEFRHVGLARLSSTACSVRISPPKIAHRSGVRRLGPPGQPTRDLCADVDSAEYTSATSGAPALTLKRSVKYLYLGTGPNTDAFV